MTSNVVTAIVTTSETFDELLPAAETPDIIAADPIEIISEASAKSPTSRQQASERRQQQKRPTVVVLGDDHGDRPGPLTDLYARFQLLGGRVASGTSHLWRQLSCKLSCRQAAERFAASQQARAGRHASAFTGSSTLDQIRRRSGIAAARLTSIFGWLAAAIRTRMGDGGHPDAAVGERATDFEAFRRMSFWRDVTGEVIGMFFVVIVGCGAGLTDANSSADDDHERQLRLALAYGIVYATSIYCFRRDFNGHFNPAVTIALTVVSRRISICQCLAFVLGQFAGALAGAGVLSKIADPDQFSGLPIAPSAGISSAKACFVEFIASIVLVFVVVSGLKHRRQQDTGTGTGIGRNEAADVSKAAERPASAAFVAGTLLVAVSLLAIPYSGGSFNTSRSFGLALICNVWTSHWIYWLAPISGGILGCLLHNLAFQSNASTFRPIRVVFRRCWRLARRWRTRGHPSSTGRNNEDHYKTRAAVPAAADILSGDTSHTSLKSSSGGSASGIYDRQPYTASENTFTSYYQYFVPDVQPKTKLSKKQAASPSRSGKVSGSADPSRRRNSSDKRDSPRRHRRRENYQQQQQQLKQLEQEAEDRKKEKKRSGKREEITGNRTPTMLRSASYHSAVIVDDEFNVMDDVTETAGKDGRAAEDYAKYYDTPSTFDDSRCDKHELLQQHQQQQPNHNIHSYQGRRHQSAAANDDTAHNSLLQLEMVPNVGDDVEEDLNPFSIATFDSEGSLNEHSESLRSSPSLDDHAQTAVVTVIGNGHSTAADFAITSTTTAVPIQSRRRVRLTECDANGALVIIPKAFDSNDVDNNSSSSNVTKLPAIMLSSPTSASELFDEIDKDLPLSIDTESNISAPLVDDETLSGNDDVFEEASAKEQEEQAKQVVKDDHQLDTDKDDLERKSSTCTKDDVTQESRDQMGVDASCSPRRHKSSSPSTTRRVTFNPELVQETIIGREIEQSSKQTELEQDAPYLSTTNKATAIASTEIDTSYLRATKETELVVDVKGHSAAEFDSLKFISEPKPTLNTELNSPSQARGSDTGQQSNLESPTRLTSAAIASTSDTSLVAVEGNEKAVGNYSATSQCVDRSKTTVVDIPGENDATMAAVSAEANCSTHATAVVSGEQDTTFSRTESGVSLSKLDYLDDPSPLGGAMPESEDSSPDEAE